MEDQFDYYENKSKIKDVEINRDSLKESGITILTGEACAMSMRLLCELTPEAMERYLSYTGIHARLSDIPKSGWNDSSKYSVFLTWNIMHDLMVMWLLESYETVFDVTDNRYKYLYAGERSDIRERFNHFKNSYGWNDENGYHPGEYYTIGRSYDLGKGPKRGFSNVHAMSGASQ